MHLIKFALFLSLLISQISWAQIRQGAGGYAGGMPNYTEIEKLDQALTKSFNKKLAKCSEKKKKEQSVKFKSLVEVHLYLTTTIKLEELNKSPEAMCDGNKVYLCLKSKMDKEKLKSFVTHSHSVNYLMSEFGITQDQSHDILKFYESMFIAEPKKP